MLRTICIEASSETPGDALAAQLRDGVCVHGIYVQRLLEREGDVVDVALAEADFVCGFAACDDDFLDAEFAGGFDDVVCALDVAGVAFVVGD